MADSNEPDSFEGVIAAYVQDLEQGRSVDTEALLARHPQYAEQLAEFLESHARFVATAAEVRQRICQLNEVPPTEEPAEEATADSPISDPTQRPPTLAGLSESGAASPTRLCSKTRHSADQPQGASPRFLKQPDASAPRLIERTTFRTEPSVADHRYGSTSSSQSHGTSSTSRSWKLPQVFGDYEILEEIDRGGMGIVFKARHLRIERIVALKIIRSGERADDLEVERFLSEAEAAAALSHPGIVPIYEVGTHDELAYYTMPYVPGESLAKRVEQGPLDPQEAVRIVHKLCAAIEFAHQLGVYHRDLKPANILLNDTCQPIIIDFGLAKLANRDQGLTATGEILGTPAYLAPENACGKQVIGPQADVYALGAVLYFLLAGQPPFTGLTPFDVLLQVLDREPPWPSRLNRRVDRQLDQVCRKALAKDPGQRYRSAAELGRDLQHILQGEPIDTLSSGWLERLVSWWHREPILVAHVCGIGATSLIVSASYALRGFPDEPIATRMVLLLSWLAVSWILQLWIVRARWRGPISLLWAVVDVTLYTALLAFATPPRGMLLVGYPMLMVASSLFYRQRFVLSMTGLCALGFTMLVALFPQDDIARPDFIAIFASGLGVICLSLLAIVRRVRGMSRFYQWASSAMEERYG